MLTFSLPKYYLGSWRQVLPTYVVHTTDRLVTAYSALEGGRCPQKEVDLCRLEHYAYLIMDQIGNVDYILPRYINYVIHKAVLLSYACALLIFRLISTDS